MKLYIHFGIYKAGSSYIQYILANSRAYLEQKSIYFPYSKEDQKMLLGLISKGNADGLERRLKERNVARCTQLLAKWKQDAQNKGCNIILISAEALVHQLAIKDALEVLESGVKGAGIEKIYAMGFFRDLVDHAISTYKHRAKTGKIPEYGHWIKEIYETPKLLENLAKIRGSKDNIEWTFRKFQKNSEFLLNAFFKDWLQIDNPDFSGRPTVNESVSLSEVLVMNEVKKNYPLVTDYFVNALKSLPKELKGRDKLLETSFYSFFYENLLKKTKGLEQLNPFLSSKEQLVLGDSENLVLNSDLTSEMTLSKAQIQIIIEKIRFFSKFKGKMILFRRSFAHLLSKVRLKLS